MKAMKLTGIRTMQMVDIPMPVIVNDTDVLIKMKVMGVCGSDIHYYTTGRIGSQIVKYPFTVGHEGAGEVVNVGNKVSHIKPDMRIAVEPAMSCGKCDQCLAGRHNTCRKLKFLGCPGQAEGLLSEYIVIPEESCFPIPETMTFDEAAISEPLAIGVYAVKQSIPMNNTVVVILGSGPIGMSVLQTALFKGASKIYITDKIDKRLEYAKQNGAFWTGNPDKEDVVKIFREKESLSADVVFECCGQQEAIDQGIEMLKPGGKLMIVGIPETERISFNPDLIRRNEITICNVRRQNQCVHETLDLIAQKKIKVSSWATHRFPFADAQEAFELVANYNDGVLKAMIDF